ncbi:MAG: nucleotidyl transferase AbiEii/AbiGii toxin family protein [Eubacteriales bacterium]|nr:nucleotidyl transferase AbiEii/AbiGii toxin family protein [Eubacteriales bacterium]MDD4630545.1 nucleotidyl transferase AbiEii/AbiGii toxin family protein [Eubacteriales bacterium]
MKLHKDKDAFQALLSVIAEKSGIREDIIEKDYYLTLLLSELASWQAELPAYFKGGTALYKAIGSLKRFSEDIDLTVEVQDCSKSQGKKRLETAANGYASLSRTSDKAREINAKGSITSVYEYQPVTKIDVDDALQRFGYVKVEATSFTISEPVESLMVLPLLYSEATTEQQSILHDSYDVFSFEVKTIKMERIFADKILAAEFYYQRQMLFDVAKHLYDLTLLMNTKRIAALLARQDELLKMLEYKRREEQHRIGSDLAEKPFDEFQLFKALENDTKLQATFAEMQRVYVFNDTDIIPYAEVIRQMSKLYEVLQGLDR